MRLCIDVRCFRVMKEFASTRLETLGLLNLTMQDHMQSKLQESILGYSRWYEATISLWHECTNDQHIIPLSCELHSIDFVFTDLDYSISFCRGLMLGLVLWLVLSCWTWWRSQIRSQMCARAGCRGENGIFVNWKVSFYVGLKVWSILPVQSFVGLMENDCGLVLSCGWLIFRTSGS